MAIVLAKDDLGGYLEHLCHRFVIYAPIRKEGTITFSIWHSDDEVVLDYETTNTPLKKSLFPHSEPLLTYLDDVVTTPTFDLDLMVFGINPQDARALEILDEAFLKPIEDTHYNRRRKRMYVVGYEGAKMENSFGERLGLPSPENLDMLIMSEGDKYVLQTITDRAKDLVKNGFVKAANTNERKISIEENDKLDLEKIMSFLDKGPDQPIWHELAKKCFACGVCAYVCPICHCFDVEDRPSISGDSGDRRRCWDSCMLADFAQVAGGANFRKGRHERIHNWYHHKFSRAVKERGVPDCVGCGRCIMHCPAKIDILGTIEKCEELG